MTQRRSLVAVAAAVLVAALLAAPTAGSMAAAPATGRGRVGVAAPQLAAPAGVHAYPAPGTAAAMPATGITFRDLDAAVAMTLAGSVRVTGSVSGTHGLTARRHRDGRGVTLQPRQAFAAGERVTVQGISVAGGDGDRFTFVVARPGRQPGLDLLRADGFGAPGKPTSPATGAPRAVDGPPYRTRPDLNPPPVRVTTLNSGTASGLMLTNPGSGAGVQIMDNSGQPVWFHGVRAPVIAGDLEKARYRNRDVLVWFEGTAPYGPGSYRGTWTMVDSTYARVATIRATNGMQADIHDIEITPAGRAYVMIYNPVIRDLTAFGGSANATVLELVIQEVDIASGDLIWEWHSLDSGHMPISDTLLPNAFATDPIDYIHGNSLMTDTDGNLLVSGRHTSAVYKINRVTGAVVWQLGGKPGRNDFTFAPAGEPGPSFQHDARRLAPGVISLFDNGVQRMSSRGLTYQVDETAHTATRVKEQRHVPNHFSFAQGDFRQYANGNWLVSWGISGLVTEYDAAGAVKFEATIAGGSYRTIRESWVGRPPTKPAVVVDRNGGSNTVFVSWNGETDVASWEVRSGATRTALAPVTTAPRTGFETSITIPDAKFVQVRAKAAGGTVLGSSAVVPVGPWFTEQATLPAGGSYRPFVGDFTGGRGDDVVFYAPGTSTDYLWAAAPGGGFVDTRLPAVNGDYHPITGDFVGDAHDDIIWTKKGSDRAYLWRSDGAGGFTDSAIRVPAASVARVLPHRLGPDEVLWYNPGSGADRITGYRWPDGGGPTTAQRSISVNGSYRPIIGDYDGNGWADIMWYAAGTASDEYWRLTGTTGGRSVGQVGSSVSISGDYTPVPGRFSSSGDSRDDIVWYAPGAASDYVWEGTTGAGFVMSTHRTSFGGSPRLLHGARDHLYMRNTEADGTIWVPNAGPDVSRPAGNSAFGANYRPLAGDFEGMGTSGILWYAAGSAPERLFRPRLG